MAEQIASRIKIEFREDNDQSAEFLLKAAKGVYYSGADKLYFQIDIMAEPRNYGDSGESGRIYDGVLKSALKVAAEVIHGYAFGDFSYIEIVNQADGKSLKVSRDSLERYRTKKLKFEEMVD
jgi:hypothetical protein